jgi:hypothetical protein
MALEVGKPKNFEIPMGKEVIPSEVAKAFPVPHGMIENVREWEDVRYGFFAREFRTSYTIVSPPRIRMTFSVVEENFVVSINSRWLVFEDV